MKHLIALAGLLFSAPALAQFVSDPLSISRDTGTSGHKVPWLDGANTWSSAETFTGGITSNAFATPGTTLTLSGGTIPTPMLQWSEALGGTSTVTGSTSLYLQHILTSADNANIANGVFTYSGIQAHVGGSNFDGLRVGYGVALAMTTASNLSNPNNGLIADTPGVRANVNAGGTGTGFGVSNFGVGAATGSNPGCQLQTGATWWLGCTAAEFDGSIQAGASADHFSIVQVVITHDHATQGAEVDQAMEIASQVGASAGVHQALTVGRYDSQFPLDTTNGYIFQAQSGQNYASVPTQGAAGFDLREFFPTGGGGQCGGGWYWANNGVVLADNEVEAGYLDISASGSTTALSNGWQHMTTAAGSITVAAGGSNWTTGDLACDGQGNYVTVTASAGAVTGVSTVVRAGWAKSPTLTNVPFTAMTRTGSAYGSGLQLNLPTWTKANLVTVGSPLGLPHYTVAGLPNCVAGIAYSMAVVTDATAPTYGGALTGLGGVKTPVFCDGTSWTSH